MAAGLTGRIREVCSNEILLSPSKLEDETKAANRSFTHAISAQPSHYRWAMGDFEIYSKICEFSVKFQLILVNFSCCLVIT